MARFREEGVPALDIMGGIWSESNGHGGYGPTLTVPLGYQAVQAATDFDPFRASRPGPRPKAWRDSSETSGMYFLSELWQFLRVRKKFWLGPIMFMLVLLGMLIVFTQGSALAPFIYALF